MITFLKDFKSTLLRTNSCLRDVLEKLTWGGQAVFFTDNKNKLLSSMSDGDLRRALISGASLESLAFPFSNKSPIYGDKFMSNQNMIKLMNINMIRTIPIVDENDCVIQVAYEKSKSNEIEPITNLFFIFAGGRGERMRPYTDNCPKPMLKVAGKPMLLHIIEKAKSEGFYRFIIAVNYLSQVIEDYFGNGDKFGVEITYVHEKTPLGTAGALSLIKYPILEPFIVSNGDVLTELSYKSLLEYQETNKADACIALAQEFETLQYGVVNVSKGEVISIEEKPTIKRLINAGVYSLAPDLVGLLTDGKKKHITTLFSEMIKSGKKIVGYQLHEHWSDVGYPKDLENANRAFKKTNYRL